MVLLSTEPLFLFLLCDTIEEQHGITAERKEENIRVTSVDT